MVPVLTALAGLLLGFAAGFLYRKSIAATNAQSIEARAQKLLLDAEREADATSKRSIGEAKEEIATMRREADDDIRARRDEIVRQERRMSEAGNDLQAKIERADARAVELEERDEKLMYVRTQLERATELHRAQLEKIAGLTSTEARDQLMAQIIDEAKRAAMSQVREIEQRQRLIRGFSRGLGSLGRGGRAAVRTGLLHHGSQDGRLRGGGLLDGGLDFGARH